MVLPDKLDEEVHQTARSIAQLPLDGIFLGKQQFEAALDAMGMDQGYGSMAGMHTLQTYTRYEPDEFNLMKEMRDKGAAGAFRAREAFLKEKSEHK